MTRKDRIISVSITTMIMVLCNVPSGAAQTVVPDGTSDTSVSFSQDGHVTIDIAPADDDRVSHNTFTRFNVPKAGLDFDNRFAGARTIVSEVTGGERSLIEGNVEILGQRAHLFIANQNGILVDGARFINTGGLALLDRNHRVCRAGSRTVSNPA